MDAITMLIESILILALLIFLFNKWSHKYWKNKNVFSLEGKFLFGNIEDVLFGRRSLIDIFTETYKKHKQQRLIGFYSFYQPMVLVTDPDIVKNILVTNFNSFADNGYRIYPKADPMFGINPFCTTGLQNWKKIRGIHAPFHTQNKLKEMYPIMTEVTKNMINYIKNNESGPIDVMEVMGCYTMENVLACAYGLHPDVFSNPENPFKNKASSKLFTGSTLANLSALFFPFLAKILHLRIVSNEAEEFFTSIVKSVCHLRKKCIGNDLISHLIKYNQKQLNENKSGFTDAEMAGHCITFYLDGYETSASALSFIFLELSIHIDVQEKLRSEILSVGSTIDDFNYDKICSLSYLSMVINESLRRHPLLPVLSRECTETFQLDNVNIERGTKVFIPVKSLHYDTEYFHDPFLFKPERFSEENIPKYAFLPFGEGPRMCLGFRFALLQLKICIISVLLNFKVLSKDGGRILYDDNAPFVVIPKRGTTVSFQSICEDNDLHGNTN